MRDTIQTERLTLRPLLLSDAPTYSAFGNDYDIAKMTGSFPHPFPLMSAEFKIMQLRSLVRRKQAYVYVLSQDNGAFMGDVSLFKNPPKRNPSEPNPTDRKEDASFSIGYWLGRPFWGNGYISEAARALLNEARATFKSDLRVNASIYTDNPESVSVINKLGFEPCVGEATGFSMARLANAPLLHFRLNTAVSAPLKDTFETTEAII